MKREYIQPATQVTNASFMTVLMASGNTTVSSFNYLQWSIENAPTGKDGSYAQ